MSISNAFSLSSVIICTYILINLRVTSGIRSIRNRLFNLLTALNCITGIASIADNFFESMGGDVTMYLNACNYVYFISHFFMVFTSFLYVGSYLYSWKNVSTRLKAVIVLPALFALAAILSNPVTHWIYSFSPEGEYARGDKIFMIYAAAAYYLGLAVIMLIKHAERIPGRKLSVMGIGMGLSIASMLLQLVIPDSSLETASISVMLLMFLLFIHNPREEMDLEYPVYSKAAYFERMHELFLGMKRFDIVDVIVEGQTGPAGEKPDRAFVNELLVFLNTLNTEGMIYRCGPGEYNLEFDFPAPGAVDEAIKQLKERFEKPWKIGGKDVKLDLRILRLRLPDEIQDEQVLYEVLRQFVANSISSKVMGVRDFDLEEISRKRKIGVALGRAIDKGGLEMRYTPVYSLREKRIYGLQAAVRFYDKETGYVYDKEIFEFAERSGHIKQVSEMIFDEVCSYVRNNELYEKGLGFIGIRIYPAMTMQYGLFDRLLEDMKKYEIKSNSVYLMLSESTLSNSTAVFKKTMFDLDKSGVCFCLEEYGSGFTDIAMVYEMPVKVIKINRSVVKAAMTNGKAGITMRSSLELAHDLGMDTMVSGIEDEEYYKMIKDADCDYATGNYFYEQLDAEGFIALVNGSERKEEEA